jgi:hypothetical protein
MLQAVKPIKPSKLNHIDITVGEASVSVKSHNTALKVGDRFVLSYSLPDGTDNKFN